MRCFRHLDRGAVGSCKHCQRGLCPECAAIVEDALARNGIHEQQVADLARTTAMSLFQAGRVRSGYSRNGVFHGMMARVFAGLGISQLRYLGIQALFLVLVGAPLLYASVANLLEARRFR